MSSANSVIGTACERLARVSGARAAGALSEGEGVVFEALPSSAVPSKRVTPKFIELLDNQHDPGVAGLYFSQDVATALSVGVGDVVPTKSGPVSVAGIFNYPDDGRLPGLGWSVLVPAPANEMFDSCWLDVPFVQSQAASFILTAVAPGNVEKPTVSQLNSRLGENYDVAEVVDTRQSLIAIPSALIFAISLGYALTRSRRLELSSALHVGVRRSALVVQATAENSIWLIAANITIFSCAAFVVILESPIDRGAILLGVGRIVILASMALLLGSCLGVAVTRERHMFRYFKER
ncbi:MULTISPECIES: hypothetical protein [unclassified Rathayibacter]|uniref:hypothetical protein n=1 Tax=unclassified Rathayibacter TaxID=2609250 RepID=UPI00188C0224|nr:MULTISPECIES: hypothetical protein [unclassified Rathayibacter]MBF4461800.1 hypothetical protein [Rathayibacter sp. VKM Ac-2879]MBF4503213.1 hypothetical protein [Rathayibacter sp. VKM Ac-2878]